MWPIRTAAAAVLCLAISSASLAVDAMPGAAAQAALSPEAIVDAQLAAYNRGDLEAFLSFYADDAVLANHPDQVTETGKAQMRIRYQRRFSDPNLRAEILKRIVFGRFVIDHERITSRPSNFESEAVAMYEIKDGKIVRVTFLKN